jgi:hypothetical protein
MLSPHEIECFKSKGFILINNAIEPKTVGSVINLIKADISENFNDKRQQEYDNISSCPDLRDHETLAKLTKCNTISETLDQLTGPGVLACEKPQIAIRYAHNCEDKRAPVPHIDGTPTGLNGLKGDELNPFTLLVGIFLTDVKECFAGNFTVWPGGHKTMQNYFGSKGETAMKMTDSLPSGLDFGEPLQIQANAGDSIICHYLLPHAAAVNVSDNDRIALFFRHWFREQRPKFQALTNLWDGWAIDKA